MEHIAIDLGGRESQVCIRSSDGRIVDEKRLATSALPAWLSTRPPSRVVMETCAPCFAIADRAKVHGHDVRIVPSSIAKALGVGARRTKSDRRDAHVLSEVSCRVELDSVHVPSQRARELRSTCNARDALVKTRTKFVNFVRGWLRQRPEIKIKATVTTLSRRVREHFGAELPAYVERPLRMLDALNEQVREADRELAQLAKNDPLCVRLMTVPGIGIVTSVRFVSALDTVERFDHAHAVESYLGMVPGEHSSGARVQRLGITKAGPAAVRVALVQAAWTAKRCAPHDPMVRWCNELAQRRGKLIAAFALARKLAGILYALWRDGSVYNPLHYVKR